MKGYQTGVQEDDKEKSGFATPKVMLFGIQNTPTTFTHIMKKLTDPIRCNYLSNFMDKSFARYTIPCNQERRMVFLKYGWIYHKFIQGFNPVATPPSNLTHKATPEKVLWTSKCKSNLNLPDFTLPFIICTDTSWEGITTALLKERPDSEINLIPIMYANRKFSDAEKHYNTSEIECLAVVWAIVKFQAYLYGREFVLQNCSFIYSELNTQMHAS